MPTHVRYTPELASLPLFHQGKTRDTYDVGSNGLLVYATDRLSTHNVVHKCRIPQKGEILTALTIFWITEFVKKLEIPHHMVACGQQIYEFLPEGRHKYPADLHHRAILVRRLEMEPVEFILRGRLAGSLYKSNSQGKPDPYGNDIPAGLQLMHEFNPLLFTPTEKSATDDPINGPETEAKYPEVVANLRQLFNTIRRYLNSRGIEFVDSKFEVGKCPAGTYRIGDEICTVDSSRFCETSQVELGRDPPWLDKEIARIEAQRIWGANQKVPLEFSSDLIGNLVNTYRQIFLRITGFSIGGFQRHFLD